MLPTTSNAAGRRTARGPRTAAQAPASWLTAAVVAGTLLVAGCAAPQATSPAALPVAATAAPTTPQTGPRQEQTPATEQTPGAGQAPLLTPAPPVPVRPATPPALTRTDPPPRFLTVDGISLNMPIVEVGVAPNGAMEIPDPFDEAGWYRFGPAPGAAAGTAVVAAHVDTTSDKAPFSQLKSLEPGTLVTVQREAAAPLTFRVTQVELMAKDAFDGASIFRRDGPPQLKLVTCGGRWLDELQDYGDNVIVTAVPA
jgi:hypothetical protein